MRTHTERLCPAKAFQWTAGSVPGRRHVGTGNLLGGKNNQDSFGVFPLQDALLATVHDGCGTGKHSEAGAQLAPTIVANAVKETIRINGLPDASNLQCWFQDLNLKAVATLRGILQCLAPVDLAPGQLLIANYFLFTTVGVLVTNEICIVFACGDGTFFVNGQRVRLSPGNGNRPAYLAYALDIETDPDIAKASLEPVHTINTKEVDSLVIGTDGLDSLLDSTEEFMPGKKRTVGAITQTWTNDLFFDQIGTDLLTPWLRQINSEVSKLGHTAQGPVLKRDFGLLEDDTTLVVIRRRKP